jgi:hypothetical protein
MFLHGVASFRGISTPSLTAQGEQRRSSIFNNDRDIPLIRREQRKTKAGDWNSNVYHLDGLIAKVKKLEPDFAEAREQRAKAKRAVETPAHRRHGAS